MIGDTMLFIFAAMFPDLIPAIGFSVFIRHCETFWRVLYWAGGTTQEALVGPLSQALFVGFPAAFEAGISLPVQSQSLSNKPQAASFQPVHSQAPLPPSTAVPFRTSRNGTSEALTDICTSATHLGIIGTSGAGKSTLLEVLTLNWANAGVQVIVIDPHAGPTKWHGASQVVGNSPEGPNFDEIDGILDSAIARINERLGMIYNGHEEDAFPRIAIICDEWRDIAFNVPNAGDKLARILSTARKVSIKMVVGTQSKNVKALFGDGRGDGSIRDCLTILQLTHEKVSKARYAILDGERYDLPAPVPVGMFPQTPRSHSSKPEVEQPFPLARPTEREPEEDNPLDDIDPDKRTMILMLYQNGWNRDRIANVALKGTRRSDALKTIRLVLEHQ